MNNYRSTVTPVLPCRFARDRIRSLWGASLSESFFLLSTPHRPTADMTESENQENGQISAGKSIPVYVQNKCLQNSDEIALYDRQIRLWGMQAQEK